MTLATDDWPSHADELTRKTSEQLAKWNGAYSAGAISKREFYITVSALYDATMGLIHRDVSDLMADIHKELRNPPVQENTSELRAEVAHTMFVEMIAADLLKNARF